MVLSHGLEFAKSWRLVHRHLCDIWSVQDACTTDQGKSSASCEKVNATTYRMMLWSVYVARGCPTSVGHLFRRSRHQRALITTLGRRRLRMPHVTTLIVFFGPSCLLQEFCTLMCSHPKTPCRIRLPTASIGSCNDAVCGDNHRDNTLIELCLPSEREQENEFSDNTETPAESVVANFAVP